VIGFGPAESWFRRAERQAQGVLSVEDVPPARPLRRMFLPSAPAPCADHGEQHMTFCDACGADLCRSCSARCGSCGYCPYD